MKFGHLEAYLEASGHFQNGKKPDLPVHKYDKHHGGGGHQWFLQFAASPLEEARSMRGLGKDMKCLLATIFLC